MQKEVKVVRSPIVKGFRKLPNVEVDPIIINVMLPNGMIITSPDQFQDDDTYDEYYSEETITQ